VQGEFARLVKNDPRFDMELRAFLPRTYNLKAIADYQTGSSDGRAGAGGYPDGAAFVESTGRLSIMMASKAKSIIS